MYDNEYERKYMNMKIAYDLSMRELDLQLLLTNGDKEKIKDIDIKTNFTNMLDFVESKVKGE